MAMHTSVVDPDENFAPRPRPPTLHHLGEITRLALFDSRHLFGDRCKTSRLHDTRDQRKIRCACLCIRSAALARLRFPNEACTVRTMRERSLCDAQSSSIDSP